MIKSATLVLGERQLLSLPSPWMLRALVFAGCFAAGAAALLLVDPGTQAISDPALGHLLRGMAAIKGVLALGAAAALAWRFGRPIGGGRALLLMAGCWIMAAAAGMIWQLAHIGAAAVLFHSGELGLLGALWWEHRGALGNTARP